MAGCTDRGLVRRSNEDSYVILRGQAVPHWCIAVAAVFDGVGGLSHGHEASYRASKYLGEMLIEPAFRRIPFGGAGEALGNLMLGLHARLREDRQDEPALRTMATTATIALLTRASPVVLWIGHVGDSPAFRISDGFIEKLIMEDSLVAGLLMDGLINPEQVVRHPQRHLITQALGHNEEVQPRVSSHRVDPGDRFLLCTDGLTTMLPEAHILEIAAMESAQSACRDLISEANITGGLDNITVVLMRF